MNSPVNAADPEAQEGSKNGHDHVQTLDLAVDVLARRDVEAPEEGPESSHRRAEMRDDEGALATEVVAKPMFFKTLK